MSLFDTVKEKAAELLGGASDKVNELTGIELPGTEIAEQLTQTTTSLTETGQNIAETAGQNLTDSATGAADTASGAVTDAFDPRPRG